MAVQQNKKSPSKRGMHRAHNALTVPGIAVESQSAENKIRSVISRFNDWPALILRAFVLLKSHFLTAPVLP